MAAKFGLVVGAFLAAAGCTDAFVPITLAGLQRTSVTARISPSVAPHIRNKVGVRTRMCAEASATADEGTKVAAPTVVAPKPPTIPKDEMEMVKMAAQASVNAFNDGITRQKMRILMPRDGLLQATDENWPGGIMELYKSAAPCVRNLVRKACVKDLAPKIREQRLDESGVDGISLFTAECTSSRDDVSAFCQPSAETVGAIEQVCSAAGPRVVLIVNPQWRETNDGYDQLGAQKGLLGQIGNFLGGTADVRGKIVELGFKDVYLLQQFVVRGDDCQILFVYGYDSWVVWTKNDSQKDILIGEQKTRPSYQDIEKMLETRGITNKWARDIGLGNKFE
ncbi:hypothetical protein T484DRAFT_2018545 [Baffinella frigidus]|nr:hypothetical protein T484DRAFT_2018545 [Cryptophyta sp. CCMP2293]